jgi:TPR repeat protein
MLRLARRFAENGDTSAAAAWYRKAADAGETDAYVFLAALFADDDPDHAWSWLEKGEAAGDQASAELLARLRQRSRGRDEPPS